MLSYDLLIDVWRTDCESETHSIRRLLSPPMRDRLLLGPISREVSSSFKIYFEGRND